MSRIISKLEIAEAFSKYSIDILQWHFLLGERERLRNNLDEVEGSIKKLSPIVNSQFDEIADKLDKRDPNWRDLLRKR